jgi:hypothetical protein
MEKAETKDYYQKIILEIKIGEVLFGLDIGEKKKKIKINF